MSWLILVLSGLLEAVWATALGRCDGLTRLAPTTLFAVGIVLSMLGLAYVTRTLPIGTAYAVWVGIGAAVTVGYAMISGDETASLLKVVLIGGVVACVIGLKLAH